MKGGSSRNSSDTRYCVYVYFELFLHFSHVIFYLAVTFNDSYFICTRMEYYYNTIMILKILSNYFPYVVESILL